MKMHRLFITAAFALAGCASHTPPPEAHSFKHPVPSPPPVSMPLDSELKDQARRELDWALNSPDEYLRAHAIEELKQLNTPDAGSLAMDKLGDLSPLVRKAAALAIGELQYRPATDRLSDMLATAKGSERIAIIFALHRLGDTNHSHELEKAAADRDPHIRGDTALVLGMLGDKSALPILHALLKDPDRAVRLEAADSLWRMGDTMGLDGLEAATLSSNPDDRMIALLALAEPRDNQVLGNVEGALTDDYVEVGLVAARAAGMLGSDDGYGLVLQNITSPDVGRRVLAGMALAAIARSDSQPYLRKLLVDTNPDVRLAAAGAILTLAKKP